jgi:hypothetical protein
MMRAGVVVAFRCDEDEDMAVTVVLVEEAAIELLEEEVSVLILDEDEVVAASALDEFDKEAIGSLLLIFQ